VFPVTITIDPDLIDEPDEQFQLVISNPTNATIADDTGIITIQDDDTPPVLPAISVPDVTFVEDVAGGQAFVEILLTLDAPALANTFVTVNAVPTAVDPATIDVDYTLIGGQGHQRFAPEGTTVFPVTITIDPDLIDEPDEQFQLVISNPTNATIADDTGIITIQDDDLPPPDAMDDDAFGLPGSTRLIPLADLLSNDVGVSLTYASHTGASHGSVSWDGTIFRYTPDLSFVGFDSFTYTVQDASGQTDTATVNITDPRGCTIFGTAGDDTNATLSSPPTNGDDVICLYAGDDNVDGLGGSDTIHGDWGSDTLRPGDDIDDDWIYGFTVIGVDDSSRDQVSYSNSSAAVTVRLDLQAAQGRGADTLQGIEDVTGSPFDDQLFGDAVANRIDGLAGDDRIEGGDANDTLIGGDGRDWIRGDAGDDAVAGGPGADILRGNAGDDTLAGEDGDDRILGGAGRDFIEGRAGADRLEGGNGDDTLRGGSGDDVLLGEAGSDLIFGQGGDDTLIGGPGNDDLRGGSNTFVPLPNGSRSPSSGDWVVYASSPAPVAVDLASGSATGGDGTDVIANVENIAGSSFNDVLSGDQNPNVVVGDDGADTLRGRDGADLILGGNGADNVWAGDGRDTVDGEAGNDVLRGGAGRDAIWGGSGADQLFGGTGTDSLRGEAGPDSLFGGRGADILRGGSGADTLYANNAANTNDNVTDRLSGDGGTDSCTGTTTGPPNQRDLFRSCP
ncbi:MAG: Ig-like domain-containing protein, partial [Actinomycetota bacterium]